MQTGNIDDRRTVCGNEVVDGFGTTQALLTRFSVLFTSSYPGKGFKETNCVLLTAMVANLL
jgi:hypothetical protein